VIAHESYTDALTLQLRVRELELEGADNHVSDLEEKADEHAGIMHGLMADVAAVQFQFEREHALVAQLRLRLEGSDIHVSDLEDKADEATRIIRGLEAENGAIQLMYVRENELIVQVRELEKTVAEQAATLDEVDPSIAYLMEHYKVSVAEAVAEAHVRHHATELATIRASREAEVAAVHASYAAQIALLNGQSQARVDIMNSTMIRAQQAEAAVLDLTGKLFVARECSVLANRRVAEVEGAMRFATASAGVEDEEGFADEEMSPFPALPLAAFNPLEDIGQLGQLEQPVFALPEFEPAAQEREPAVSSWWRYVPTTAPAADGINRRPARTAHARLVSLSSSFCKLTNTAHRKGTPSWPY
jgi:uncharacterized coiled-coil protein SlyX